MEVFQGLFSGFIDIVLFVVSNAEWLCLPVLAAFILAFVSVMVFKLFSI